MSDPHEPGGLSVTLKKDGKDASWIVFHGSVDRIKEDIGKAFDMEADAQELSLVGLALNADNLWKGTGHAGRVLGARATSGGSPPWDEARAQSSAPAEPVKDPLFAKVESAEDVPALKLLFAENKSAFDANTELFAAWKAKGKSIQEAAK